MGGCDFRSEKSVQLAFASRSGRLRRTIRHAARRFHAEHVEDVAPLILCIYEPRISLHACCSIETAPPAHQQAVHLCVHEWIRTRVQQRAKLLLVFA